MTGAFLKTAGRFLFALFFMLPPTLGFAQQALPEPLSLEQALALIDESHPDILLAKAMNDRAGSRILDAESRQNIKATLTAGAHFIEPVSESDDRDNNDSRVSLLVRKQLSDFGRYDARLTSRQLLKAQAELNYLDKKHFQKLAVMEAFFNTVLADITNGLDNELVAVAFFEAYKARDQHELGRISEIELLEAETGYQEARLGRHQSELSLRVTRNQLANALNRPNELSETLVMPDVPDTKKTPDFDITLEQVLAGNRRLQGLQTAMQAAEQAVVQAKNFGNPALFAEMSAFKRNRVSTSRHPFSAGIVLEWPLATGGERDAKVAEATANLFEAQALLAKEKLNLQQHVLNLWTKMDTQRIAVEALAVAADFRDLYLERSRARYELELIADLGDAMAQSTIVSLKRTEAQFKWMLARQELIYLGADMEGKK